MSVSQVQGVPAATLAVNDGLEIRAVRLFLEGAWREFPVLILLVKRKTIVPPIPQFLRLDKSDVEDDSIA